MRGELLAEEGEVVLFERGGCEGSFGVEEAGELGDCGFTLALLEGVEWSEITEHAVPFLTVLLVSFLCFAPPLSVSVGYSLLLRTANMYGTGSRSTTTSVIKRESSR